MMKTTTLTVELDIRDEVLVLRPQGRFDAYQVAVFNRWMEEQTVAIRRTEIVINLESVQFVDTLALSTLVRWLKVARNAGGDVKLCCLQPPVQTIFEISRINRVFAIYSSEEDATAAFRT